MCREVSKCAVHVNTTRPAWYLNSFSADPGAEAEQYLNKGVCVVFQTEASFKNYVAVTQPAA